MGDSSQSTTEIKQSNKRKIEEEEEEEEVENVESRLEGSYQIGTPAKPKETSKKYYLR